MRGVLLSVFLVGSVGLGSIALAKTLPAVKSGKIVSDKKIKTSGPEISVQKPERPFVGEQGQVINGKWFAVSLGIRSNLPRDIQRSVPFAYGLGSALLLPQKSGVTATHAPLEIRTDSRRR